MGEIRQGGEHEPGRPRSDDEDRQAARRHEAIHPVDGAPERLGEAGDHRIDRRVDEVGDACRQRHGVGHAAVEVHAEGALAWAEVLQAAPAVAAAAAVEVRLDRNEVALAQRLDTGPDRLDVAGDLVAEHDPRQRVEAAFDDLRVGAADPHRGRPHAHLARAWIDGRDRLHADVARTVESHAPEGSGAQGCGVRGTSRC
jgi:hypothetical protein